MYIMTISGLTTLQSKISAHEAVLDKATKELASLTADAGGLSSLIDAKKAQIQQVDPKLVGEPRSRSAYKIAQVVSHIFYAIKSSFHARFGSLSSDLDQYQSAKIELEGNLAAQKLKTAEIKSLNAEISKLHEQKFILENQLVVYTPPPPLVPEIPDMVEVLQQIPVVRLATTVISTASGLFSGACSYVGSFFRSSTPAAERPEREVSSSTSLHSSSGSSSMSVQAGSNSTSTTSTSAPPSPRGEDRFSETSSASDSSTVDATVTDARQESTGQEILEKQLGLFGAQYHPLEFGQDLARRFFPPVDNVVINYDKASESIVILDVTFTSKSRLDTTFKGYKAVFSADKKLRLELNMSSKQINFEPGKFVAQSAVGNFGLTSMKILESGNLLLSGLPLTGLLSWAVKKPQDIETTAEDFESTFGSKRYIPC